MKLVSAVVVVFALVTPVLAQQSPSGTSQAPAQATIQIESNSIVGSAVRSPDGKDLGKISKLMIDPREGRVTTAVISMGSKLGMGGRNVAVPWSSLRVGQDQQKLVFFVDQHLLDQAPSASPSGEDKQKSAGDNK